MISEFIEANELEAKLIRLDKPAETLLQAFSSKNISPNNGARCTLFVSEETIPTIVLAKANARLDESKITKLLGVRRAMRAEPEETEEITGYPEEFLPPISVYGARLLVDLELKGKKFIYCAAGDNKYIVKLPLADLEKSVDDLVWGNVKQ